MTIIKAHDLARIFTVGTVETQALRGVDFEAEQGEFVAIIGKSGAGKSTLMYQLSLLDHPTRGTIVIDGHDTQHMSSAERTNFRLEKLGYVFQDYALVPELTAEENVMLPLLMRGEGTLTARMKSRDVLSRLGLEERLERRPGRLSGGEQQRVSIARAIAHEPVILFADEPTANLDTETSVQLLNYLQELHKAGQTVIMVTHELEYAAKAQRVIVMEDGKILRQGSPIELRIGGAK
jgi:putative ABC transport system ATP-binding protein